VTGTIDGHPIGPVLGGRLAATQRGGLVAGDLGHPCQEVVDDRQL
jgi:hypothetical protein